MSHTALRQYDRWFWPKVVKTDTCWLWAGRTADGYGRYGRCPERGAHVVSWEIANGPVPDGLVLDHLCRVRHCVNPKHLEAVTFTENIRRGQAPSTVGRRTGLCKRGHQLTPGKNQLICRPCANEHNRRYKARKRAAA